MYNFKLFIYCFIFLLLLGGTDRAVALQEWNILALRVDFPLEEPDQLTTTGTGAFDLRSFANASPDYFFPYDTPPHDRRYFENHLEALARYYQVVSDGKVEIRFEVFPRELNQAYTLPEPALAYGNGRTPEEIGNKWVQLLRAAVERADVDPAGPRFADFNSFLVFHAGVGHETGELNDIRSVFLAPEDLAAFAEEPLLVDEGQFEIKDGWILPAATSLRGQGGLNGLMAKFFGHQLGLPGLSNFDDGLPAVGGWSLMDVGANSLGFVLADSLQPVVGFAPAHPMAWSKARLGWIEPLEVWRDTTVALVATDRSADLPKAVRIPIRKGEYFLLENRQQRGSAGAPTGVESRYLNSDIVWIDRAQIEFSRSDGAGVWLGVEEYDAFIPGSGILVWHVDENRMRNRTAASAINDDPVRPGIVLEEADGYRDIGNPVFERLAQIEGGADDLYYVGGQTSFGAVTRPDSKSNAGNATGIHLEVLSEPGDTMRVEIRFAGQAPGWPQRVDGASLLQGADVDGDGSVDLLLQGSDGVRIAEAAQGLLAWQVGGARFLASGDANGDGRSELFVALEQEVEAWEMGEAEPLWRRELAAAPTQALYSDELGLYPGRPVLALGGTDLVLLDARSGEIIQQENEAVANLVVGDRDGDGAMELVAATASGVWQLQRAGLEEWPTTLSGPFLSLASGDLEGDGRAEFVVTEKAGEIEVLKAQDDGFKKALADSIQAPVLGDVDGDGFVEIVLAGTSQVHVLRQNGIRQTDFPARLARSEALGRLQVPPVLLDLDGNGDQEIFLGTRKGIYGLGKEGTVLPGFPLLTADAVDFSPLGADLDGDGLLELAAVAAEALYLWEPQDFSSPYEGRLAGWGQNGYSAARSYAHPGSRSAPGPQPGSELLPPDRAYCYPNPVADGERVYLRFFLNEPARIQLEVFDAIGERIQRIDWEQELATPAENEMGWSTRGYASGLYVCRLQARTADGREALAFVRMAVSR